MRKCLNFPNQSHRGTRFSPEKDVNILHCHLATKIQTEEMLPLHPKTRSSLMAQHVKKLSRMMEFYALYTTHNLAIWRFTCKMWEVSSSRC